MTMLRKGFNKQLKELNDALVVLANAANESVHKAGKAYIEGDKETAHELFSDDLKINAMTAELEKMAYRLVVLQQPVAQDLRMIITVLYASNDLERIADHAVTIARCTIRSEAENKEEGKQTEIAKVIGDMVQVAQSMINDVIDAYLEEDVDQARLIAGRDGQLDSMLAEVYKLSSTSMREESRTVNNAINDITVASSLERIGDYVTNICERIIFLNTGEIVELN